MTMQHEDREAIFEGDEFTLAGVATYDVEVSKCFDADIGGTDGLEVGNVELVDIRLDDLRLTREQVVLAAGKDAVDGAEYSVYEYYLNNPDMIG